MNPLHKGIHCQKSQKTLPSRHNGTIITNSRCTFSQTPDEVKFGKYQFWIPVSVMFKTTGRTTGPSPSVKPWMTVTPFKPEEERRASRILALLAPPAV